MSTSYVSHVSPKVTPQSEKIPGSNQVPNSAGGYAYPVDDWVKLDRFLILGAEGGSYYATERKMTQDSAAVVNRCLAADQVRTIDRIVEISEKGLAPKNDPAIFALALALAEKSNLNKDLAEAAVNKVCRIGTHLFQLAEAVDKLRGWGRSMRRVFANWYATKDAVQMAHQCVKYQSRGGWSHKDVMHLCHLRSTEYSGFVQQWVEKGIYPDSVADQNMWIDVDEPLAIIWAFERAKRATTAAEIVNLIGTYNLPRECIPTQWLNDASVWEALLVKIPLHALVRNLATMTRVGLLVPMSAAVGTVLGKLASAEQIRKSRLHPIAILTALKTYAAGRGVRGQNTWAPVQQVVDALDGAFYTAFENAETTGKRWCLALDVSGSMNSGDVAGVPGLTPRVASSAMALVTAAREPQHAFMAFSDTFMPLNISPRQRIDDVCRVTARMPFSGTDCALPMLWAMQNKVPVDVFAVYTDSETWHGAIHPTQALAQYRQKMGIPAKLIVVGMTANEFSIADPGDAGMLDVVGFDASAPAIMANFAK